MKLTIYSSALIVSLFFIHTIHPKFSVSKYFGSFFSTSKSKPVILHKEFKHVKKLKLIQEEGNITIQTWKQKSLALEISKQGSSQYLKEVHIDFNEFEQELQIKTDSHDKKGQGSVNYHILLPEQADISISCEQGTISITNSQGKISICTGEGNIEIISGNNSINAKTSKGNISIQRSKTKEDGNVNILTEQGSIYFYLSQKINFDINAESLHGKVTSELLITLQPQTILINDETMKQQRKHVLGIIGKSISSLKALTYSGNIYFYPYI